MKKIQYKWKNRNHPAPQRSKLNSFAVRAAHHAGLPESFDWFCSVEFVNDNIMTRRNRELLGHEGTTDVITFSYFDGCTGYCEDDVMVELILNPDAAIREGSKREGGYPRELALYIVHGMLHSAGEDDLDPVSRRRMRRREKECLEILEKSFDFGVLFPAANMPLR